MKGGKSRMTHRQYAHGHDVQLRHFALRLKSAAEGAYGHIIVIDLLVRLQSACSLGRKSWPKGTY